MDKMKKSDFIKNKKKGKGKRDILPSFFVESLCFVIHRTLAHACLAHKCRGGSRSACRGLGLVGIPVGDQKNWKVSRWQQERRQKHCQGAPEHRIPK